MKTSSFKDRALKVAQQISDKVEIGLCPVTDKELYFMVGDGRTYMFDSYGTCEDCKKDIHISAMKMVEGVDKCSWPVHYTGASCKTCYYKDNYNPNNNFNVKKEKKNIKE